MFVQKILSGDELDEESLRMGSSRPTRILSLSREESANTSDSGLQESCRRDHHHAQMINLLANTRCGQPALDLFFASSNFRQLKYQALNSSNCAAWTLMDLLCSDESAKEASDRCEWPARERASYSILERPVSTGADHHSLHQDCHRRRHPGLIR